MKYIVIIASFLISLSTTGQDFNYLCSYKFDNVDDATKLKEEVRKSVEYLFSIPLNEELKNRNEISSFLLKWNGIHLKNGFHINPIISKIVEINNSYLSVYLACITSEILENYNNSIGFERIEKEVIKTFIHFNNNNKPENNIVVSLNNELMTIYEKEEIEKGIIETPNRTDSNGLKQGLWTEDFSSEEFEFAIVNYKDGILNGEFNAYLSDNSLYMKGYFENGQLTSSHYTFFKNGEIKISKNYDNGSETGTRIHYFENGCIYIKAEYLNNKLNGEYYQYHSNGELDFFAIFENGKRIEN